MVVHIGILFGNIGGLGRVIDQIVEGESLAALVLRRAQHRKQDFHPGRSGLREHEART
ncbi:hypothetical protein MalM25_16530 [Planctomycetes bacterium MalM25]|nr:hypothetical protein MalM25_16530 [Planctomycetes bacterium MalM25]